MLRPRRSLTPMVHSDVGLSLFEGKTSLVFGGGGLRCLSMLGALREVWKVAPHLRPGRGLQAVSGVSAGALVALLVAAGISEQDLVAYMAETGQHEMQVILMNLSGLIWSLGMDDGLRLTDMLTKLLEWKWEGTGVSPFTLRTLHDLFGVHLTIVAYESTSDSACSFSSTTTGDMSAVEAVVHSMRLPGVFSPGGGQRHLYLDGGLVQPLPLPLMPCPSVGANTVDPETCVFFRVVAETPEQEGQGEEDIGIVDLLVRVFRNLLHRHEAHAVQELKETGCMVIDLPESTSLFDFVVTPARVRRSAEEGSRGMVEWITNQST